MDIGTTIAEVRKEYKEYLSKKNPEWAERTVKTYVSDAFYIWNNSILPGFWKLFLSNESMEKAKSCHYSF